MNETIKIYTADVNLNPDKVSFTRPYLILYSETEGYLFLNKMLFSLSFKDTISLEDLAKKYNFKIENVKEFKEWI
jgi:hypothetical protein